jgi:hypothetical protein
VRKDEARAAIEEANRVLDRITDFIRANHVVALDDAEAVKVPWAEMLNRKVDYLGWWMPELYETLVHLTKAVEILVEDEA